MSKTRWMVFAGFVAAFLVAIYWHYFSRASIPHEAIQLHLRLTASSIYEFHNATGRWPKIIPRPKSGNASRHHRFSQSLAIAGVLQRLRTIYHVFDVLDPTWRVQ